MAAAAGQGRLVAVRRVLAWVVTLQVLVLALTGLYLAIWYQPTPTQAWGVLTLDEGGWTGRSFTHALRTTHRWTAWSMVLPVLVLAVVAFSEAMVRWRGPARRRSGALAGPAVVVATAVALVTGFLLPWDQLALKAVTVGSDIGGFGWLLGDDVRFVLRDGLELSVGTVRVLFLVHVVLVSLVLAAAPGSLARRDRVAPATT